MESDASLEIVDFPNGNTHTTVTNIIVNFTLCIWIHGEDGEKKFTVSLNDAATDLLPPSTKHLGSILNYP